ncbi:MAG: bifunctional ornithine acetyltransferase/N-acetylglutamate synthase, partial [Phototrophicales bacterium]|nr:bifunctional ornithine acetyltransferase/N-acetylglutamate synthase [Phototrophicales bacterium]
IMAAAGRAGVSFNPDKARLSISTNIEINKLDSHNLVLFEDGTGTNYDEEQAKAIFAKSEIFITLDLNMGQGDALVWTCDMSHDYISINSHYRS